MNILQINTLDKKGGAAKVAYALKNQLEKRGHTTSMFVARKYSQDNNVFLLNDSQKITNKLRRKMSFWLANDIDLFSSDRIIKTDEFKKADIIHCHNLHGNFFNLKTLVKLSAEKPIVWTFHDMWPITSHCAHAFDGKINEQGFFTCPSLNIPPAIAWHNEKYLEKRKNGIYKKSKFHIVTPSKWLAEKVKLSILRDKPLSIIYNGIDDDIFRPIDKSEARRELGLPHGKKIIIIVAKGGASNPWKGGSYSLEAINALRNDPGVYFVNLGGNANKASDNLKSVSYVQNESTLAKYYAASDILLYPSLADNCPLVVLEALACGLPVISFNTGGIPELIEDRKNGYIAEYRNINDLVSGVRYFLGMTEMESENIRRSSSEKVKSSFTLDLMTDNYIELYNKIISEAPLNG